MGSCPAAKVVQGLTCKADPVEFRSVCGTKHCFVFISPQAISFLTPLAVIFVVKIIQRTDRTEIKEACLGMCSQLPEVLTLCYSSIFSLRKGFYSLPAATPISLELSWSYFTVP